MKKILFIVALYFTLILHAELPPYIYEGYQKQAPEALRINVLQVRTSLISPTEKSVEAIVEVLTVKRSKTKLHRHDKITIVYTTTFRNPLRLVGPSSIPILKKDTYYKAFLRKGKGLNYYPAAKGKSFN
jgi:hypothetical protein